MSFILEKSFLRHSSRTVSVVLAEAIGDMSNLHGGFLVFSVLFLIILFQTITSLCLFINLFAFATAEKYGARLHQGLCISFSDHYGLSSYPS